MVEDAGEGGRVNVSPEGNDTSRRSIAVIAMNILRERIYSLQSLIEGKFRKFMLPIWHRWHH